MMILAGIEVIELANSPQQQHCLDTDDEYGRVTSRGHYDCVDIKLNTSI